MGAPVVVTFRPCSDLKDFFPIKGPQPKTREKFSVPLNETSSLVDHVYLDVRDPFSEYGYLIDPRKKPEDPPVELLELLSLGEEVVESYQNMIFQHLERRVSFFFQQLVCCYQTKLHFEIGDTLDQGESPNKVTLKAKENKQLDFQRNAAHSNTLPCLSVSDYVKWKAFQRKEIATCDRFVFLKGTDSYRLWNSTMNMPRWVNNADIIIDGTDSIEKLRKDALKLLNKAAQGKITPDEAIETFMENCLKWIQEGLDSAGTKLKDRPKEIQVLKYYKEDMEYIQQNFSTHRDLVLQSRLNVRLPPSTPESFLKTIYQIRYRAIRDSQLAQSKIVKKIEAVRREILGHGRKPDGFTAAFRALLVEQAYAVGYTENEDPKAKTLHKINRQRMEKLYNFSPTDYEEHRIAPSYKSRYLKTKAELSEKHLQKIHAVVSTVLEEMKKVRKDERIQRGLLTKELRHARHWSKETLAEKIKELFPESTLTASRIKTIEKDQAEVSNSEAQELQHVFDERIQSGSVVQEIRLANGWSKETLVEKIKGLFLRSAFTTLTIKKIEKSKKLISSSAAKALRQIFGEEVQNDLTIEELRNAKGWSQKELVEKIKELFLDSDLDASTIDKLEKSQEPIPRAVEKELHQAFNLSLELFIPHFFYE